MLTLYVCDDQERGDWSYLRESFSGLDWRDCNKDEILNQLDKGEGHCVVCLNRACDHYVINQFEFCAAPNIVILMVTPRWGGSCVIEVDSGSRQQRPFLTPFIEELQQRCA